MHCSVVHQPSGCGQNKLGPKDKLRPFCSHYEYYCTEPRQFSSPISKPLGQWKVKGCSAAGGSTAIAEGGGGGGGAAELCVLYVCGDELGRGRRAVRAKRAIRRSVFFFFWLCGVCRCRRLEKQQKRLPRPPGGSLALTIVCFLLTLQKQKQKQTNK